MDTQLATVVQLLLAACGVVILAAPKPAAIVAWVVSAHLDPVALVPEPSGPVGLLNAVRIMVFPTVLWLRLGIASGLPSGRGVWLAWAWAAFVVYVIGSLAWTPRDMLFAGIKQVGYLVAYAVGAGAVVAAYRRGFVTSTVIGATIYIVLALAVAQTYVFGNPYGDTLHEDRFVSFGSKQQFGEGLVALLAIVALVVRSRPATKGWYVILLVVAELLNGSRVGLAGMAFVLGVWLFQARTAERMFWGVTGILAIAVLLGFVAVGGSRISAVEGLRVHEVWRALQGKKGLEGVGTWKARVEFWGTVTRHMSQATVGDLLFGRGVSSGGRLGPPDGSEPNRIFHNEYLRSVYEFGVVGSVLFGLFLVGIVAGSIELALANGSYVWLAFVPALLGFLGVENVLSGAGAAGGVGIVLVLGAAAAPAFRAKQS